MVEAIVRWYDDHARDLPWRRAGVTPWQVLVSEVMLQQTPVSRVLPVYDEWIARWPNPRALSESSVGDAVRVWGRLGYPRRAVRLHAAAVSCRELYEGAIPNDVLLLRALPGVGDYTAAAVAVFAFAQRHAVLDTNVRRVNARMTQAVAYEPKGAPTRIERAAYLNLLPRPPGEAARASVAVMELGALVCSARKPKCGSCPVQNSCRWRMAGYPEWQGPRRRGQTYEGTDRQCRGRILAALRMANGPVTSDEIDATWSDPAQRSRAIASLLTDGLMQRTDNPLVRYQLPP